MTRDTKENVLLVTLQEVITVQFLFLFALGPLSSRKTKFRLSRCFVEGGGGAERGSA